MPCRATAATSPSGTGASGVAVSGSDLSIYNVDFVAIPTVERHPPALAGLHWFGVVQYIGNDRPEDWTEFYSELFGFRALADNERFGIPPKGRVLGSPDRSFWLQLIKPEPGILDVEGDESLQRIAFGTPVVWAAVAALGATVLLVCSSTSTHASADRVQLARDRCKLAMLALPLRIKVATEGMSWGLHINEFPQAWDVVRRADTPNLGIGIDSFHVFATKTALDDLDLLDPDKIFLVQLADFMWQEIRSVEERITTARHFRVFPGEGVHSAEVAELVTRLDRIGYRGDYSFEVFNDDYQQMRLASVAERARRSAIWLGEEVLRRAVPLPGVSRLRRRSV